MEFHDVVSLVDRVTERMLTLVDVGEIPDVNSMTIDRLISVNKRIRKFYKLDLMSLKNDRELGILAYALDATSVMLPDVGVHGRQLAEEINLISSKIRQILYARS